MGQTETRLPYSDNEIATDLENQSNGCFVCKVLRKMCITTRLAILWVSDCIYIYICQHLRIILTNFRQDSLKFPHCANGAFAVHPKILGGISAIIEIHTIASARWKKSCTIKLIFAIGFHRSPFFQAQYDHLSIGCDHPFLQIHYGRLWDISGLFNMALKTTLPNTPADWQQTINKHLSTKRASKHKIVVAQ